MDGVSTELIILMACVLFIITGVLYLVLTKKKRATSLINDLHSQLMQAGIEASVTIDKNYYLEKIGDAVKKVDNHIEAVSDIQGKDFDYIFVHSTGHQTGSDDYWQYIVIGSLPEAERAKSWFDTIFYQKRTELRAKRNRWPWSKVFDIYWIGDTTLAHKLNSDIPLRERISQLLRSRKHPKEVFIYCHQTYKFAVIRTPLYSPEAEDFEIMNIIARHIKSAWFTP
jgi:hypothetical protein